jgi:hypothetical protein
LIADGVLAGWASALGIRITGNDENGKRQRQGQRNCSTAQRREVGHCQDSPNIAFDHPLT